MLDLKQVAEDYARVVEDSYRGYDSPAHLFLSLCSLAVLAWLLYHAWRNGDRPKDSEVGGDP